MGYVPGLGRGRRTEAVPRGRLDGARRVSMRASRARCGSQTPEADASYASHLFRPLGTLRASLDRPLPCLNRSKKRGRMGLPRPILEAVLRKIGAERTIRIADDRQSAKCRSCCRTLSRCASCAALCCSGCAIPAYDICAMLSARACACLQS
jgi:hypothetical protein